MSSNRGYQSKIFSYEILKLPVRVWANSELVCSRNGEKDDPFVGFEPQTFCYPGDNAFSRACSVSELLIYRKIFLKFNSSKTRVFIWNTKSEDYRRELLLRSIGFII
jgi:hypothetical protein